MTEVLTVAGSVAHLAIVVGLGYRVIMRRRPPGVSLAWITLIGVAPLFGAVCYLAFGETRLGERNEARVAALLPPYRAWLAQLPRGPGVDWAGLPGAAQAINRLGVGTVGIPTLPGNRLSLESDAQAIFRVLLRDIEAARKTLHMQFYIWNSGGTADDVVEAVLRAAARGVRCRVLLDAVGSAPFLRHEQARRLRKGGVEVVAMLPTGLLRSLFVRGDHRVHRKLVVIDGAIAYTGSFNLVDPAWFKQDAGVGEWVDAMARIEGPAVEALEVSFIGDWELGTGVGLEELSRGLAQPGPAGTASVQVFPSGPGYRPEAIHRMILMTIYSARRELVLTTPYFVPSDALLTALQSAAERGVRVTIVLPARNDSVLVSYASRSTFEGLLVAGVRIARFRGGLLHTKSITVDDEISTFGSVNLDLRSFYLNFEISLFIYDQGFTQALRGLQEAYLARSELMELDTWRRRPRRQKLVENVCNLASPLL